MNWRSLAPRKLGGCPAGWELSRALSEGNDYAVMTHVRSCPSCGAEWAALARTSEQAQSLPAPVLSSDSRERIAMQLAGAAASLAPASTSRRARRYARRLAVMTLLVGAAAAAAAGVAFRIVPRARDQTRPVASLASIRAVGTAAFSRLRPPPDELVRLEEGRFELDVAPPSEGRRFRIATADAEIDAPQGRFSVEASAHMLSAVRVFSGHVEVRARGGGQAALHAGDEWTRWGSTPTGATPNPNGPPEERAPPPRPAAPARATLAGTGPSREKARPSPRPVLTPTPPTPPPLPSTASAPQRASFERGWRLLRTGEARQAAEAFDEVAAQSDGNAIVEDALFWRAVALARANLPGGARSALAGFISRFPSSVRVGEASAMLGWMLVESGDVEGARRAFERARHDRVDRVRASAEAGLARVDAASGKP
jgi:TolA-binding protein